MSSNSTVRQLNSPNGSSRELATSPPTSKPRSKCVMDGEAESAPRQSSKTSRTAAPADEICSSAAASSGSSDGGDSTASSNTLAHPSTSPRLDARGSKSTSRSTRPLSSDKIRTAARGSAGLNRYDTYPNTAAH